MDLLKGKGRNSSMNRKDQIKELLENLCLRIRNKFPNSVVFYNYNEDADTADIIFRKKYFTEDNRPLNCALFYRVSLEDIYAGVVEAQYTFDEIESEIRRWEMENLN